VSTRGSDFLFCQHRLKENVTSREKVCLVENLVALDLFLSSMPIKITILSAISDGYIYSPKLDKDFRIDGFTRR
jgi:hypothetical protein